MKKFILILLFIGFTFNLNAKIIIQEATYTMGDDDSKASARNKAILKAKRDSIEQAGVFVSSYSEFSNGKLNDTIESFSGSIMKVTILNEKFSYPNYFIKIKSNIDIKLLNKKLKQFSKSGVNVDDQISSSQNEIEQYNKKLAQLLKEKNKRNELKNLQEKKKRLIKKVNNLANNKAIDLNIIKNRDYGYITVTSNVKDAEIYIDGKYVGYAPIERFKVPSGKDIELKAVADKRYYPEDEIQTINIKRLTTPSFEMNIEKGKAEIFLIGDSGSLFVNGKYIKELNENNKIAFINAGNNTKITVIKDKQSSSFTKNLYSNNLYEIDYKLNSNESIPKDIILQNTVIIKSNYGDATIDRMWLNNPTTYINLNNAKKYCKNLKFLGYDDWLLPDINELMDISYNKELFNTSLTNNIFWSRSKIRGKLMIRNLKTNSSYYTTEKNTWKVTCFRIDKGLDRYLKSANWKQAYHEYIKE